MTAVKYILIFLGICIVLYVAITAASIIQNFFGQLNDAMKLLK